MLLIVTMMSWRCDVSITITDQNAIVKKSKTKQDGVYTYRGIYYKVIDNKLRYLASCGEVLQCFGNFNVVIGSYEGYSEAAKKALKSIK
jgi:hypothetical protein